jgi:hypothetical protein
VRLIVLGAAMLLLAGCQYIPVSPQGCVTGGGQRWRSLSKPPPEAVQMLLLLEAKGGARSQDGMMDYWFASPQGTVMLCRADAIPVLAHNRESWFFLKDGSGELKMEEGDLWVTTD